MKLSTLWSDLIVFVLAYLSHWQSYATGGVVTGIIYVAERLLGKQLSKKLFGLVFVVVFSLAAFFMAWRDEFRRANALEQTNVRVSTKADLLEKQLEGQQSVRGSPSGPAAVITGFGIDKTHRVAWLTVNTATMDKYAKDFSFLIILRIADNSVELLTDKRIEKSAAFLITGETRKVEIKISQDFIVRADSIDSKVGQVSFEMYTAMIPKNVNVDRILTLGDVMALGGMCSKSPPTEW